MSIIILAFIVYLIILVLIGIWSSKFNKTLDDFLIAGRKLGSWPVAISAEASDMSGWLVMGLPGRGFMYGIAAFWTAIGASLGTLFNWSIIAKRLRRFTHKLHALTIPDFLEDRFKDDTHVIRGIATTIITIFMVAYVSVQMVASGKILSETFGWDYNSALILGFAIITFYTLMGGFVAVAWTDVFQGMLMVGILLILPIVGIIKLGGLDTIFTEIGQININTISPGFGYSGLIFLLFAFVSMSWFFGYPGQPHIITRYMAIKDEKKIWNSTLIGMTWVIISLWGAVLIGIIGLAMFKELPDPEKVMPLLVMNLLPEWAAGIAIAAITAAIMSTADSQLLVATSAIVEDVYHKLINPEVNQKKLVLLSRISVVLLSIIAFLLALQGGVIYFLVAFAWGGLAASFGPLIILSLWWRRTTKWGAIAGMISGTATVIIWDKFGISSSMPTELIVPGMLPAFFISLLFVIIISLLTVPPDTKKLFA
ncbi:MAG: sodium/proline symporter [Candidatus Thermoplasmatota archaeon]|jgi:sodium/proline symporter|nr:sodium/proline symporter [Candidatus Thermoplasmatota archaeon]